MQAGHYDLIGPHGEIILPQVWEVTVEPDWQITMILWPPPEKKKSEKGGDGIIQVPTRERSRRGRDHGAHVKVSKKPTKRSKSRPRVVEVPVTHGAVHHERQAAPPPPPPVPNPPPAVADEIIEIIEVGVPPSAVPGPAPPIAVSEHSSGPSVHKRERKPAPQVPLITRWMAESLGVKVKKK